jgi:hypothetical protein
MKDNVIMNLHFYDTYIFDISCHDDINKYYYSTLVPRELGLGLKLGSLEDFSLFLTAIALFFIYF